MARTVGDALKVRNQFLGFRVGLLSVDWDTTDLVQYIDEKIATVEQAAGRVVFPPGDPQSRIIKVGDENLRFNQVSGHFEPVVPEDPETIFLPNGTPPADPPDVPVV